MMDDQITLRAREMIEAKLLDHPDEGVRMITAMFGVPDAAVESLAAKLRAQLNDLAAMPDSEIDCSDVPETLDWSNAKRGRFAASTIEARSGETGTGSTEGKSAVRESGDAGDGDA